MSRIPLTPRTRLLLRETAVGLAVGIVVAGCAVVASASTDTSVRDVGDADRAATRPAATDTTEAASPLLSYFDLALAENPGVRSMHEEWNAAREAVHRVEGFPDPQITYGYFLQSVETALGPQEHVIGLMQKIPWPGKLGLRGEATGHGATAAGQRFQTTRLGVLQRVAKAYYELAYLEQAILVTRQNLEYVQYQERVARTRYSTGTATHPDVIKAQVELGVLEDRLRSLEDRRVSRTADLNAVLGRPADEALPYSVDLADAPVQLPPEAEITQRVDADNPDLRALDAVIEQQQSEIDVAHRDQYPDFTLGIQTTLIGPSDFTMFEPQGRDAWVASVSMNVPLWRGKYSAAIQQAQAQRRRAEARKDDRQNQLRAAVEEALYELRDSERRINLYRDSLIPKGEQSLQATSTAFQTGAASFLDFIDAQRTLLRFQLDLARAEADRGVYVVKVMALMGAAPGDNLDVPEDGSR